MMFRSLAARLSALQQGVATLAIVMCAAASVWLMGRVLYGEESAILTEAARRLALNLDLELKEEGTLQRAAEEVLAEESAVGLRVDVYDPSGRLVATSATRPGARNPFRGVARAPDRGAPHRVRMRAASGAQVEVSMSDRLRVGGTRALLRRLIVAAVLILLVTLVVSRWTVQRALRQLAAMADRAQNASIDPGVRTLGGPTGIQEIDHLRAAFDRLLARLDDAFQRERRFASDASHEFRTPLTVLAGELELALGNGTLPDGLRPGLGRASRQVRAMQELVEALLLLRCSEAAGFEPVNLADIAREVVAEVGAARPLRVPDLTLDAPDEVLVAGNPALLNSAVRNLVDNAVKFTRPSQVVRLAVNADPSGACVMVEDAGQGIVESERDLVFDPFYRGGEARAEEGGVGLGLPIMRRVVEAHGGSVTVGCSALGGARFELKLPLWRRDAGRRDA